MSKIIVVAPSAYLLGGVQTWLDYLLPGLETIGWEATLLLVDGVCSDAHLYLRHHPFRQVRIVTNPTGSREGRVRALAKSISLEAPDFVLGVNIADVYSAVMRVRRMGKMRLKVAMALHGLQHCFYEDIASFKSVLDGVIATNRLATAAAVQMGGIQIERACYAPCGVVVPNFPSLTLVGKKLNLLYAGRFDSDEKRVMDLPLILAALDKRKVSYNLRLAGAGPAEQALRKDLAEFGDKVEFLGVLSEEALRTSFYTPGAVLLIMSPSETGPLVAWDAMANGVALVTSRFTGIGLEGSLRDGENCLTFTVGDTEMAANALEKLVNPDRRLAYIAEGYRMVSHRYSRAASIENWDRALRQILALPDLTVAEKLDMLPAAGRLDRALGVGLAERLRCLLRTKFVHQEPGGEWPHSYSEGNNADFYRELAVLDKAVVDRV